MKSIVIIGGTINGLLSSILLIKFILRLLTIFGENHTNRQFKIEIIINTESKDKIKFLKTLIMIY